MKLTKEQVLHVAKLARLGLREDEISKFQTQLSGILDYVEMLNEVNTDGIEPTAQVTGLKNVTEEDIVRRTWDPKRLLESSPLTIERNQVKTKPIFE